MNGGTPWPVLDLFAGYGGFSLAFDAVRDDRGGADDGRALFRTIGFSEIDPYVSAVLAERFVGVPNLGAVQHVTRDTVLATCGVLPVVVTGGFPCQPHSVAGSRGAGDDDRDLWGECARVLRDLRPPFAVFENVRGIFTSDGVTPDCRTESGLFFNGVLSDLADLRYACQWAVVSASDVGAPHRRDRVWLLCVDELAYTAGHRLGEGAGVNGQRLIAGASDARELADGSSGGRRVVGAPALARHVGHVDGGGAGLADAAAKRIQGRWSDGEQESSTYAGAGLPLRGCATGRAWPAAEGRWPAPPGHDQYDWEPDRVVGGSSGRRHMGDAPESRLQVGGRDEGPLGEPGAVAEPERPSEGDSQGGEAEPDMGGGAYGSADRLDATPLPLPPAAVLTFNDAREAGWDARNVNNIDPDELERIIDADEGAEAQGDGVNRTHRLKATGNGIVPACAYIFAAAIADVIHARGLPQ